MNMNLQIILDKMGAVSPEQNLTGSNKEQRELENKNQKELGSKR